jgi:bifunctional non-homologous end joining protein LigD
MKWDGIRIVAGTHRGQLRMRTRQGNDVPPSKFPELASLAEAVDDVILDGELTVFDGKHPDFGAVISRLRGRPGRAAALAETQPSTVIVFDVLRLDGVDLRGSPYIERRAILEGLELPPLWLVPPTFSDGAAAVAASLEHGLEGVVAKKLTSKYVSRRSRAWIKHRHEGIIDAVVIGWRRTSAGGLSLFLAEPGPGGLVHTGRCTAPSSLLEVLAPLAVPSPPVPVAVAPVGVQWVRPALQVEVTAASRSPGGRLRHPRFVRPRLDQLE